MNCVSGVELRPGWVQQALSCFVPRVLADVYHVLYLPSSFNKRFRWHSSSVIIIIIICVLCILRPQLVRLSFAVSIQQDFKASQAFIEHHWSLLDQMFQYFCKKPLAWSFDIICSTLLDKCSSILETVFLRSRVRESGPLVKALNWDPLADLVSRWRGCYLEPSATRFWKADKRYESEPKKW